MAKSIAYSQDGECLSDSYIVLIAKANYSGNAQDPLKKKLCKKNQIALRYV
uniref:Uncharacterized protein n=1 Tax=Rhizophagus irregularis (strain DAOM 181602 / DAOM 197198 / MUCL 43194) TaxID=747089 RepID=U9U9K2_RHIID